MTMTMTAKFACLLLIFFFFETHNTISFGWLIKHDKQIFFPIFPANSFNETIPANFFVDKVSDLINKDDIDRFCLKTLSTIPFGWLIKLKHITIFLLLLPGGALSALLLERGGVEALMKLPSLLLSLLSLESSHKLLLLRVLLLAFF